MSEYPKAIKEGVSVFSDTPSLYYYIKVFFLLHLLENDFN